MPISILLTFVNNNVIINILRTEVKGRTIAQFMLKKNMAPEIKIKYKQPFEKGTKGSEKYRIPAIYTLEDGSVIAAADMRYGHGSDSPNNIDTLIAMSKDGYSDWEYKVVNYFDDYADGVTAKKSASFIDTAIVQTKTGRIIIITDAWTADGGYPTVKKGTGFVEKYGKKHLLLTTGSCSDNLDTYEYYIGNFENGFAPVLLLADDSFTGYTVDADYHIFKNGEPVYQTQVGSDKQIQQNVYYEEACFSAYRTCYLWVKYSDDNGRTWSKPINISSQIKNDNEAFVGIGPGRGIVTQANGNERIVFCVYDNTDVSEKVSTVYSDDNGITWKRGEATCHKPAVGKTSEAQIVTLPDGTLRMYARNAFAFVAYADSTDGGVSWSKFKADINLASNGNCMVSFINLDKKINGKNVILGSFASDQNKRADGVVAVGIVSDDNSVDWIYKYNVNSGFFAYSCLTQLSDGNIGLLYEDEPAHISYMILTLSDKGTLSEINGKNIGYVYVPSFAHKMRNSFRNVFVKLLSAFNLL